LPAVDKGATNVDVMSGYDITAWDTIAGGSVNTANSFTTTSTGGFAEDNLVESGYLYTCNIAGTTDATNFTLRDKATQVDIYSPELTGSFDTTFQFTASDDGLYVRHLGSGTTTFTTFEIIRNGSTLTLTPEGMYSTAWRDFDHDALYSVSGPSLVVDSYHNAYKFNGTDSYGMIADANFTGTGGKLITGWFYAQGYGEGGAGRILDNGQLIVSLNVTAEDIRILRDGATDATTTNNSVNLNEWTFYAIVSPSDGDNNQIWLGNKTTAPTNQVDDDDAGTPADGGDLYFGADSATPTKTFDGILTEPLIYDLDKITGSVTDFIQLLWETYK